MRKTVLITGVLGGIGRACAKVFADDGWHVVGCDRRPASDDPTGLEAHSYIQADVSTVSGSRSLFDRLAELTPRLDALINNAAIQLCKPLVETTPEEWDEVFASNLKAVYLSIRHGYSLMREHGGAIVNVSSVHAIATSANIAAYAASKGGLLALTRALAIELASKNIRVNAVLPGATDTAMLRAGVARSGVPEAEAIRALGNRHLRGTIGEPHEVARAIVFLASDDHASFVTGQSLVVDGGATCRLSTEVWEEA